MQNCAGPWKRVELWQNIFRGDERCRGCLSGSRVKSQKKHDDKERFSSKDFFFLKIVSLFPVHVKLKDAFAEKWFLNCTLSPLLPPADKFCNYSSSKSHFCSNSESWDNFDSFCCQKFASNQVLRGQFDCFFCTKKTTLLLVDNCPTQQSLFSGD